MRKALVLALFAVLASSVVAVAADRAPDPPPPPPSLAPAGASAATAPASAATPVVAPDTFRRPSVLFAFRFMDPARADMLVRNLGLTGDDRTKVLDVMAKFAEAVKPKMEAQRQAAEDFATVLCDASLSQSAVAAAGEKTMKADNDLLNETIKTVFAIRALLTKDQLAAFNRALEQSTLQLRRVDPRRVTIPRPATPAPAAETGPNSSADK